MIKMTLALPEALMENIKSLALKEEVAFAIATRILLELGWQTKQSQENQTNKKQAEEKTTEYLLRILNLCGEIYRFTFNDRTHYLDANDPNTAIHTIKEQVIEFLNEDSTPTD